MSDRVVPLIDTRYPIGSIVTGKVQKIWKFGLLIDIEKGVTGLIRTPELSWDEHVSDATEFIFQGDRLREGRLISAMVIRTDTQRDQLLLSLRQALYDPWKSHSQHYTPGLLVKGIVKIIYPSFAIIEMDDHITARMEIEEVVPWKIRSIESILEKGDHIEAIVVSRDENRRQIIVSMKSRLDRLVKDISLPQTTTSNIETEPSESPSDFPHSDSIHAVQPKKVNKILIIDDEEAQYLYLETILEELGYQDITCCGDFRKGVDLVKEGKFDLILLDIRGSNGEVEGITAAEDIIALHREVLIVLVTGEERLITEKRVQQMSDEVAGLVLKPLTMEKIADLLGRIERTGHAGWPGLLSEKEKAAIRFVRDIAQTGKQRRSQQQVIGDILTKVTRETRADKSAVFSMDFRTNRVQLISSKSIQVESVQASGYKLPKSPVNDVVCEKEHIFENDIENNEGKYRNLRRVIEFRSCIAVPVPGATDDIGYGIFVFHSRNDHFNVEDLIRVEAAADIISWIIREQWLIQQVAADQRLTLLGSTITSIGHELRNHVGALEVLTALEKAWQELKKNPELLTDANFSRNRIEHYFELLNDAKRGTAALADILLGAVKERQEQMLDPNASIESALKMVEHRAVKAGITLKFDKSWLPKIHGSPLELQQIFVNMLVNSIEQIPNAHREQGSITIQSFYNRSEKEFPVAIRITDTGPGIHTRNLDKIFEPMVTTKPSGTGMGLYICRDLLSLIGGRIRVEATAIMVGSSFIVELPGI